MSASRGVLAALCVLLAAAASADEGAYLTLVSMGRVAAVDRGPDAGAAPTDSASRPVRPPSPGAEDAPVVVAPLVSASPDPRPAVAPPAGGAAAAALQAVFVQAAATPAPRPRRRPGFLATLLPSRRRAVAFAAPALSTGTFRARPLPPAEDDSVRDGSSRGMAELLSTAAAPDAP